MIGYFQACSRKINGCKAKEESIKATLDQLNAQADQSNSQETKQHPVTQKEALKKGRLHLELINPSTVGSLSAFSFSLHSMPKPKYLVLRNNELNR